MVGERPSDAFFADLKSCVGPKGWITTHASGKYFADPRGRFVRVSGPCMRPYNVPNDRVLTPSAGGVGNQQ